MKVVSGLNWFKHIDCNTNTPISIPAFDMMKYTHNHHSVNSVQRLSVTS